LEEDLEVIGEIVLELYASSTNNDTDFIVKLSDQSPQPADERKQGRQPASVNVTKGWLRASHRQRDESKSRPTRPYYTHADPQPMEPGRTYKFEIELLPCAYLFKKGNRIRLEISNADSPMTDSLFSHQYMWYKVGADTIVHDASHPSRLILPIAKS
jgi:putative CocE/NonD family hydrolase